MREWLKKQHFLMKALSLLIAFIMWFAVLNSEQPTRPSDFDGVPVVFDGADKLLKEHSLALAGELPKVSLTLRGQVDNITAIDKEDITVRVDLSGITEAGVYELDYTVPLPAAWNGISIIHRSPAKIKVEIDDVITVALPVQVNIGKLGEGLEADRAIAEPAVVEVRGLRRELESAVAAEVNIKSDQLGDSFEGDVQYRIVDAENRELTGSSIVRLHETTHVRIPIYRVKEVPLTLSLTDGSGALAQDAVISIQPATVVITGAIADIDPVTELSLGTVSLDSFLLHYTEDMPLSLPEGVNLKEEMTGARVDVTLPGIESAQFTVTNIEVVNMPVGISVDVETPSVTVTVRGKADAVAALSADSLKLIVDLRTQTLVGSTQLVRAEAEIEGLPEGVGVYGNYQVFIRARDLSDGPAMSS